MPTTTNVAARAGYGQEKRGKDHYVPVHSKAKEAVDLWLERSYLASKASAPLFPSFGKNREAIELRRLDRRSVLKLVEKRARTSGILKRVCCHSFRATGVTEYMNSGGKIEIAQRIAGHTSPSTTKIYDRSADQLAQNKRFEFRARHILDRLDRLHRVLEANNHIRVTDKTTATKCNRFRRHRIVMS